MSSLTTNLNKKSYSMIASWLKMEVMSSPKMCCVCVRQSAASVQYSYNESIIVMNN
jgi:hypothetical protein